ncbi:MAG: UvrD-helicase domain-containing protein [Clostridia bacterium]|nr:UvrD-helicase domain-containing protein [Clostridia bacterium]
MKSQLFDLYYSSLNDRQREAVYQVKGPLLVLAGAGSGKTTVLTRRIAHIIRFGDAVHSDKSAPIPETMEAAFREILRTRPVNYELLGQILQGFAVEPCEPWRVLAITFTNKAAGEIKARLESVLGSECASQIWAGTFHSICVRILRRYIDLLGFRSDFTIFDSDDSKKLLARLMKDNRIDEKQIAVKSVQNEISRAKNALQSPDEYAESTGPDFFLKTCAKLYQQYQANLKESNALDFDDILVKTVELLEQFEEPRLYYQRRFSYVLVDEYQDTNPVQFRFVQLVSEMSRNIMVVGDDDQSIYKFRGATIENILSFDTVYRDAKCIYLEQNYRSTGNILAAANAVIANNQKRKGKNLWCEAGDGEKIGHFRLPDQEQEAVFLANRIAELVSEGKCQYRDCAVLYRVSAQANALEAVFAKSGLPHRQLSGIRFYDRAEIKDVLAYLCVLQNPDDDLHLLRIINVPRRGIGDSTVAKAREIAEERGLRLMEVLRRADEFDDLSRASGKLKTFVAMLDRLREGVGVETLSALFQRVIDETGYYAMLEALGHEAAEKIDNVRELISSALTYEEQHEEATLSGFLEEAALISDIDNYDETANAAVLMTIHSAKGLEFDYVFLPGMEETIFPSMRNWESEEQMEEERRLAYVAITRAKKQLTITTAKSRLIYGQTSYNKPSRFVTEIPEQYLTGDPVIPPRFENGADFGYGFGKRDAHFAGEIRTVRRTAERTVGYEQGSRRSFASAEKKQVAGQAVREKANVFGVGARVEHPIFGEGMVLSAKPMAQDVLYEIAFDSAGTKKLMGNYAKLSKKE